MFENLWQWIFKKEKNPSTFIDDSLESLHQQAIEGSRVAIFRLTTLAGRTHHPKVKFLLAEALIAQKKLKFIDTNLAICHYLQIFKEGKDSEDPEARKFAALSAKALAELYKEGLDVPKSPLLFRHYYYEFVRLEASDKNQFLIKIEEQAPKADHEKKAFYLNFALMGLSHLENHFNNGATLETLNHILNEQVKPLFEKALNSPKSKEKEYVRFLKNGFYTRLGKLYEKLKNFDEMAECYENIKPQNLKELNYLFQAVYHFAYKLNDKEKAREILEKPQSIEQIDEKDKFLQDLKSWREEWEIKIKKIEEDFKKKVITFKEKVNPFKEIYIYTPKGKKKMSQEYLLNKVKHMDIQEFEKEIQKYRKPSLFRQRLKKIIENEEARYNSYSTEKKEEPLIRLRRKETESLREALEEGIIRNEELEQLEQLEGENLETLRKSQKEEVKGLSLKKKSRAEIKESTTKVNLEMRIPGKNHQLVSNKDTNNEDLKRFDFYWDRRLMKRCHDILTKTKTPFFDHVFGDGNKLISDLENLKNAYEVKKIERHDDECCFIRANEFRNQIIREKNSKKRSQDEKFKKLKDGKLCLDQQDEIKILSTQLKKKDEIIQNRDDRIKHLEEDLKDVKSHLEIMEGKFEKIYERLNLSPDNSPPVSEKFLSSRSIKPRENIKKNRDAMTRHASKEKNQGASSLGFFVNKHKKDNIKHYDHENENSFSEIEISPVESPRQFRKSNG